VVETLQVGLMEDKGGVTFQASYQDAPRGVVNLGEEESDSSSSSSSEDEEPAGSVSERASAASGKAPVTGSTRSRGKAGASLGWESEDSDVKVDWEGGPGGSPGSTRKVLRSDCLRLPGRDHMAGDRKPSGSGASSSAGPSKGSQAGAKTRLPDISRDAMGASDGGSGTNGKRRRVAEEGAVGTPAEKQKHVYTEADANKELFGSFEEDSVSGEEVSEEAAQERVESVLEELAAAGGGRGGTRCVQAVILRVKHVISLPLTQSS
jgi:hypothetical protein